MEVILLEDVKSVGKKGELVELKEGYAKNFILPKKLGVEASAISHIKSGRNKPSFDFVVKILAAFPHINPDWLLLFIANRIFKSARLCTHTSVCAAGTESCGHIALT